MYSGGDEGGAICRILETCVSGGQYGLGREGGREGEREREMKTAREREDSPSSGSSLIYCSSMIEMYNFPNFL